MSCDLSEFVFDHLNSDSIAGACVCRIPSGISNRSMLFNTYFEQGMLPEYFGSNWDAFDESLCDFTWLKQYCVIIIHDDIPSLDPDNLRVYLEILSSSVAF